MDDALLTAIAERYGTPTYVYDLDRVGERVAALRSVLPGARLHYAVKANPNGAVVQRLARLGVGAEVITVGELERAVRAGVPPERVLVGGPAQGEALRARAGELGAALASLDSEGQWGAWSHAGGATRFLVRVNPGLDPGTHEHLATGAPDSKFGLPPEQALTLARRVADAGKLAGFHVHAGSMIRDVTLYDTLLEVLSPLYRALPDLPLVDLGGGFAVPGFPLDAFAARATRLAARLGAEPILEPGRFLVADAGVLLTRVLHVKGDGPRTHVIADAGMADLLRPALYGADHPVRVADPRPFPGPGGRAPADLDGPLCENADRLGRDVAVAGMGPGALLAVARAGAYGFAMASNYASSLRPAEVVVDGGEPRLARRRERVDDLWRLEETASP